MHRNTHTHKHTHHKLRARALSLSHAHTQTRAHTHTHTASTLVLTAVAAEDVLLLEAFDAEVEVLASPAVLEDVAFALGKNLHEPSSPVKLGAGLASLAPIGVSTD